jgi:hypothetical protein
MNISTLGNDASVDESFRLTRHYYRQASTFGYKPRRDHEVHRIDFVNCLVPLQNDTMRMARRYGVLWADCQGCARLEWLEP